MKLDEATKAYEAARERWAHSDGWWYWKDEFAKAAVTLIAAQQAALAEREARVTALEEALLLLLEFGDADELAANAPGIIADALVGQRADGADTADGEAK